MQVTETLNKNFEREIKVVIKAADLAEKLNKKIHENKSRIRLNGFRPGKVPELYLRQLYGKSWMAEIINTTIQESSDKILQEREERPAVAPEVAFSDNEKETDDLLAGKSDLVFHLKYEVLPDVPNADLAKISIEREIIKIAPQDVDQEVERLLSSMRNFIKKEGEAALGDRVTIDYVGMLDDKPFENGSAEKTPLILGSNQFIPGFEEQLIGSKAGEEKEISVTFPNDYPAADLAGKLAKFKVTVHEVAAPEELKITDETVKKIGLESVEQLKKFVLERMENQYGQITRQEIKKQILDAVDAQCPFAVPHSLVEQEFDTIWQQAKEELARNHSSFEQEGTNEAEAQQQYRGLAERRVRLGLVLAEIGKAQNIEVQEHELQRALAEQIRRNPRQEKEIINFFKNNPQAISALRAPIFEEKVIDYILTQVKTIDKEVKLSDFLRREEEKASAQEEPADKKNTAKKTKKTTAKSASKQKKAASADV